MKNRINHDAIKDDPRPPDPDDEGGTSFLHLLKKAIVENSHHEEQRNNRRNHDHDNGCPKHRGGGSYEFCDHVSLAGLGSKKIRERGRDRHPRR